MEVFVLRRRNMNVGFGFGRCRRYIGTSRRTRNAFGPYGALGGGYGRACVDDNVDSLSYKELLEEQKDCLTQRLEEVETELESM